MTFNDDPLPDLATTISDPTALVADEHVVYEIVDTEHPENNAVIDPDLLKPETPEQKIARREEAFQRAAHQARIAIAQAISDRRAKENSRALVGRVTKRRKKQKLAKASRKKNR